MYNAKSYLKPEITFEILDKVAISRVDDRTAEQLQKERSKSFESLMNKTKKSAELLGFVDPFFRFTHLLANTAILKLSASVPGISGVKMFRTAR